MSKGWKWGGQFAINLEPRWTTSYHAEEGFQVSRGNKRGISKGSRKARGLCVYIVDGYVYVYI
jgi:hypothetical protein